MNWMLIHMIDGRVFVGQCKEERDDVLVMSDLHYPQPFIDKRTKQPKQNALLCDQTMHLQTVSGGIWGTCDEVHLYRAAIANVTYLTKDCPGVVYIKKGYGANPPEIEVSNLKFVDKK